MRLYSLTPVLLGVALLCGVARGDLRPAGAPLTATSSVAPAIAGDSLATVTLHVEGMTCGGCVLGVRKVLTRLEGVTKAEVSYETKQAVVHYDPAKVSAQQMIAAIATLRYTATVVEQPAAKPAQASGTAPEA